jgi:hypothetical protein
MAANNLDLVVEPLVGGTFIGWQIHLPYLLIAFLSGIAAIYLSITIRGYMN